MPKGSDRTFGLLALGLGFGLLIMSFWLATHFLS